MKRQSGLTIVELMITVAIAAVLMGIALPAFNSFIEQRRFTTQTNDFLLSMQYARSEATRQGTSVSVQAVDDSSDPVEWELGWCVVIGTPGDCPNNATNLRQFEPLAVNTLAGLNPLNGVGAMTFNSRGLLVSGVGGNFNLCSTAGVRGRQLSLSATGRVSSSEVVCP